MSRQNRRGAAGNGGMGGCGLVHTQTAADKEAWLKEYYRGVLRRDRAGERSRRENTVRDRVDAAVEELQPVQYCISCAAPYRRQDAEAWAADFSRVRRCEYCLQHKVVTVTVYCRRCGESRPEGTPATACVCPRCADDHKVLRLLAEEALRKAVREVAEEEATSRRRKAARLEELRARRPEFDLRVLSNRLGR